jgi:hypothetical protein
VAHYLKGIAMTKRQYVEALSQLYYVANLADSDSEYREPWLEGHEGSVHCQAFDKIVRDLGLGEYWGNIIEGDYPEGCGV